MSNVPSSENNLYYYLQKNIRVFTSGYQEGEALFQFDSLTCVDCVCKKYISLLPR